MSANALREPVEGQMPVDKEQLLRWADLFATYADTINNLCDKCRSAEASLWSAMVAGNIRPMVKAHGEEKPTATFAEGGPSQ